MVKETFRKALKKLFRRKEMFLDDVLYMTRYYLLETKWFSVYIHDFNQPDSDRRLHDHPWKYGAAVILSGSYLEQRVNRSDALGNAIEIIKTRRWFNWLPMNTYHRIAETSGDVITLFMHTRRVQEWGFMDECYEGFRWKELYRPTWRNYDKVYDAGDVLPHTTNRLPPPETDWMSDAYARQVAEVYKTNLVLNEQLKEMENGN